MSKTYPVEKLNNVEWSQINWRKVEIKCKQKFVLDADISKCFDRISHDYLLGEINTSPTLGRAIKAWLKAGWVFEGKRENSDVGTPQGGVISPLLANIALHGMENRITQLANSLKGDKSKNRTSLTFVRSADDFVCLHPDREVIDKAKSVLIDWLDEVGLELSESKTRISHTSDGFNFSKDGVNVVILINQLPGLLRNTSSLSVIEIGYLEIIHLL